MKFLRLFRVLLIKKHQFRNNFCKLATYPSINSLTTSMVYGSKNKLDYKKQGQRRIHLTHHFGRLEYEDQGEDSYLLETEDMKHTKYAKDSLFKNPTDHIITELNNCASVDEVLRTINKYNIFLKPEHITHTVLVLKDLKDIYFQYNNFSKEADKYFVTKLLENKEFINILKHIQNDMKEFNLRYLGYTFLFLYRLGISPREELMQNISYTLKEGLEKSFCLEICSQLFRVIFTEKDARPYYLVLDLIPKVIESIGNCSTEEFGHLTSCLNRLHNIISDETMQKYKNRVEYFLKNDPTDLHYSTTLKIVLFLNYPKWRTQNSLMTSHCLLLLKNEIDSLDVNELLIIYEVFLKNLEPGVLLNSIQRCAAKFLQQFEDCQFVKTVLYLRLFSVFLFFSPPNQKSEFRKNFDQYLKYCTDIQTSLLLGRLLSYVKVSDRKICQKYWDLSLKLLDTEKVEEIRAMCLNYQSFSTDLTNFRHYPFERKLCEIIEKIVQINEMIYPGTLVAFLNFAMLYSRNECLIEHLIKKCELSFFHMTGKDCLHISDSLTKLKEGSVSLKYVDRLKTLTHNATMNILSTDDSNFVLNTILLKAALKRNDYDDFMVDHLLYKYKEMDHYYSKMFENLYHIFLESSAIVPEVVNKITEYIVNQPDLILGFNVSRIVFLCYELGYQPLNDDNFFETVINIIIRDQERLSGLAFLQGALSLCFFTKLPSSFIKQIFNVEFMDKLDLELANCYSKDKYPLRVRSTLMMLNRGVCLEYPEYNVPWFHKKYVEEVHRRRIQQPDTEFTHKIKDYLSQVVGDMNIQEDVVTPYGYHINFAIGFNSVGDVVPPDSKESKRRLAFLLLMPYAFTKYYIHLKGRYQMKIRHIEILGYEISIIKFNEWDNLLYTSERLEYIRKAVWGEKEKSAMSKR